LPASYCRKAADSHSLDCSGALLDNVKDAAFISDFISTHQFTFEYMNFGCCQLTPESLDYLLDKEVKHLRTFIIRDNNLKKAAGYVIAKLLGSRGRISTIDAQNNSLGDVGVSSIAGGFTSEMNVMKLRVPCPTLSLSKLSLRELDLSGNDITDLGVIALCSGLRAFVKNAHYADKTVSLKILRLSRNRITDKGAFSLAQLIDIGILADIEDGANSSLLSPAGHEEELLPLHLEELCISDNLMSSIGLCNILIAASSLPMPLPMPDCDNDTDIESMRWREAELESVHCDDHNTRFTPSSSASSSATSSSSSSATASASPSPSRGTKVKVKVIGKGKAVMRRLEFARCNMTLETLGALSAFLSSSWTPSTASHRTRNDMEDSIQIDFQFTDVQAHKVLDCLAVTYESESSGYRAGRSVTSDLTAIFHQLGDVIKRNERVTKVLLGALPGVLAEWKASLTEDLTGKGDGRGTGSGGGSICLDVERDADMNKDSVDTGYSLISSSSRPKTSRLSRPTELPVRSHRAAAALLEDISGALIELSSITYITEPPYLRPSSSHTAAQEDIVATRDRRNNSKNKNNSDSNKNGNNEAIAKSRQVQQLIDNKSEVLDDCAIDPVDCSRAGRAAGRSAHTTCEREDDWDWDSAWNTSIDYTSMPQLDKLDLNQGQQKVHGQEQGQGQRQGQRQEQGQDEEQEKEQRIKGDDKYCDTHGRHRHGQGSMGEERGTREDTRTLRSHSIDESLTSSAINVEAFTLSAGNRVSHGSQDRYRESCTSSLQTSPQGPPRMPYDVTHMPYDVTRMADDVTRMPYDVTYMPYDVTHMPYDVTHTAGDSNRQSDRLGADESSMGSPSFSSRVYSAFMTELPDDVEASRETSSDKIDFDYMKDDSCLVDGWAVSRDTRDDVEKSSAEAVVGLEGKGEEEGDGEGEGVSRGRVGGAEGRPSTTHEEERRGKVYNQRAPGPCRRERSRERVAQQLSIGSIGKQSSVRERHGREPVDTECVTAVHSSYAVGAGDGSTHTNRSSSVNVSRDRSGGEEVEHSRASFEKREMAVERIEDRSSHSSSSLSSTYHDSRGDDGTEVLRVSLPSKHQVRGVCVCVGVGGCGWVTMLLNPSALCLSIFVFSLHFLHYRLSFFLLVFLQISRISLFSYPNL
jgi:Leucine-rich repeat (LRR) protein